MLYFYNKCNNVLDIVNEQLDNKDKIRHNKTQKMQVLWLSKENCTSRLNRYKTFEKNGKDKILCKFYLNYMYPLEYPLLNNSLSTTK